MCKSVENFEQTTGIAYSEAATLQGHVNKSLELNLKYKAAGPTCFACSCNPYPVRQLITPSDIIQGL